MGTDRYGRDVLASDQNGGGRRTPRSTPVEAEIDLVLEDPSSGYVGAVVRIERDSVVLADRFDNRRSYPYGPGFWLDGQPVELTRPTTPRGDRSPGRTASGSIAVPDAKARVARAGRIYVEGRHDAELVEKVWGDDLRVEGVVVEYLAGVDDLPDIVAAFDPGPGRRLGVLVDHLVAGSKESRIAASVSGHPHVLVTGHPYIDIWQAVKPERVGLAEWPLIERGTSWKHGICEALGLPADDQADIARAWRRILGTVHSFRDLEPDLLGRVEELIDFVTTD